MKIRDIVLLICFVCCLAGSSAGQVFDIPPPMPLELHKPMDVRTQQMQRTAALYEGQGEYEKAFELYYDLHSDYPEYFPFYDGLIRGYFRLDKLDEGLALVDSLRDHILAGARAADLTGNEKERLCNYIIDGGQFSARIGDRDDAARRWEELYKIPGLGANPFFRLFNAMISVRFSDELETMAQKAREATGEPTLLGSILAAFYAEQGRIDAAIAEWLRLMELQPRQADIIQQRILGLPEDERTREQIESSLKKGLAKKVIRLKVVETLGSVYFRGRQWEKAYEQIKLADEEGGNTGLAMLVFAENLTSEHEYTLSLQVLADLAESHISLASSPRGLLVKAKTLAATESYSEADSIFGLLTGQQLLKTAQGQDALVLQAQMRLHALGQPEEAREILQSALTQLPRMKNSGEVALLIGDTFVAQRMLTEAKDIYLEIAEGRYGRQPAQQAKAKVNAAMVDFYSGQFDHATEQFKEASQESVEGVLTNDALDMLEMIRTSRSDSIGLATFAQAKLERLIGNTEQVVLLLHKILESKSSGDLQERSLLELAGIEQASGNWATAIGYLLQISKNHPDSHRLPAVFLQLGDIYQSELSDPKEAAEFYERILIDYPNSLQVEEARKRLRKLEFPET